MLVIPEQAIRRQGPGRLLTVCWRQWRTERKLARRGVRFRAPRLEQALAAYAAMSQVEFNAVNGRQEWANWRTIPRALSGHVPDRALRVLDLGSGTGSSTRVLAFYCPQGSHITGYEIADPMLACARRRRYRHQSGAKVRVEFVKQGVTETLREPAGTPIAPASVDLINASGIVGHHLQPQTIGPLLAEIERVLKSDGVAMLDVGPTIAPGVLQRLMAEAGFVCLGHYRSWFGDLTGEMVFRRASSER